MAPAIFAMPDGHSESHKPENRRLQILKIFRKPNILKNLVFSAEISLKL
jgi:hypothetical protein